MFGDDPSPGGNAMTRFLEHFERVRLAAAAQVDPDTVRRWQSGHTVKPASRARIEAALKRLRIRDAKPAARAGTQSAPEPRPTA